MEIVLSLSLVHIEVNTKAILCIYHMVLLFNLILGRVQHGDRVRDSTVLYRVFRLDRAKHYVNTNHTL